MKTYIGCSGWQYEHWQGKFYPKDLPKEKWFEFYQKYFNTVEINSTFYHFPKPSFVKKWYKNSKENFYFSLKLPRIISHVKKFRNTENLMKNFYNISSNLKEKLACILIQLPPFLKYSKEKLSEIISQINTEINHAIEFRHISWFNEEVFEILEQNNIIYCIISHPDLPTIFRKTSDKVYIRFHGKHFLYADNYSKEELQKFYEEVLKLKPKEVSAYFNNDFNAYAVYNALYFKKLFENKV